MKIIDKGEHFIIKIETGEGIEFKTTDSLFAPFEMIRTLSKKEVDKHGG